MFTEGTTVRFTASRLGLLEHIDARGFEDEIVGEGDKGEYVGPHPNLDGWHVIKVHVNGRDLICPCAESQFEVDR